jgi:hypothetical protein
MSNPVTNTYAAAKVKTVTCNRCDTNIDLHLPIAGVNVTPYFSVAMLIPTHDVRERFCPNCKAYFAPAWPHNMTDIMWVHLEDFKLDDDKESRILIPNVMFPKDFDVKRKK